MTGAGRRLFLTFEGGEGSGKSTQSLLLCDHILAKGRTALLLREPGGTPLGERLRQAILFRKEPISAEAELLLFLAARAEIVRSVIRPALANGSAVICDRFSDSTLAYQGYGRGLDLESVRRLDAFATGGLVPDLTLLLDLPVEAGIARKSGAIDAFEAEDAAFHERVRRGYLELAGNDRGRWLVLDAAAPREELACRIAERVDRLLA